jgi:hypothetical protein
MTVMLRMRSTEHQEHQAGGLVWLVMLSRRIVKSVWYSAIAAVVNKAA